MSLFQRNLSKSFDYLARAEELIPCQTQCLSKGPSVYVKGVYPVYLERGKGSHVWDVDGNEYIDYIMGLGSIILGYFYPSTNRAVSQQLEKAINLSLVHPYEVELAEFLCQTIPCAEMARFAKNGSDATSAAVRIARAHTRREKIAYCGYHGWQDWHIIGTERNLGVPRALKDLLFKFEYNHIETLERIFEENKGEIAAVIMEPVGVIEPKNGFLEKVKQLAHENGALFIFDEILTGFRFALGGVQEYFGVIPDLAAFGKAMANGMPISAVVGKKEFMEICEEVFFSMTFGGEILSLAAAIDTIKELKRTNALAHIWHQGQRLKDGFNSLARQIDLDAEAVGYPPRFYLLFRGRDGREDVNLRGLFMQECVKRSVLLGFAPVICYSHTDEDIAKTLEVWEAALCVVKKAADRGDVTPYMEGEMPREVFRRIER
ncbi:MAG: aspartate aminotransferase family protein [Thermoplasmata archaeon]|nr:MAG: aspartate aminotransferase family protein [Thermoplasmata archaeon]